MATINTRLVKIAQEFWDGAIVKFEPGCDVIGAANLVLPLDFVFLSELSLRKVEKWMYDMHIAIDIEADDRLLHGFIMTHAGRGIVFINGLDSEDEKRYTAAHEIAHFLLDYKLPRDKAIEKLGNGIADVLDGLRNPNTKERVHGLLGSVRLVQYSHLLEKSGDGSFNNLQVYNAENDADDLALQLLAPYSSVIKDTKVDHDRLSFTEFRNRCKSILIKRYRIPLSLASTYSLRLSYSAVGAPSLLEKLGL